MVRNKPTRHPPRSGQRAYSRQLRTTAGRGARLEPQRRGRPWLREARSGQDVARDRSGRQTRGTRRDRCRSTHRERRAMRLVRLAGEAPEGSLKDGNALYASGVACLLITCGPECLKYVRNANCACAMTNAVKANPSYYWPSHWNGFPAIAHVLDCAMWLKRSHEVNHLFCPGTKLAVMAGWPP